MEKITKKTINNICKNIVKVSYCDLQYLLYFQEKKFYTSGVYGWNADIYLIGLNTAICSGYRPFGNIEPKREIINRYEEKAKEIINTEISLEKAKKQVNHLLNEFIKEIMED